VNIVILAAGPGKRMHSSTPKVLHRLAGRALLEYVLDTAKQLSPKVVCIVYGCGGELVRRPIRPADKLAKSPPSTQRVLKPHPGCAPAA